MDESASGALASNAGDQYHFIFVARRMLRMLHPRYNLKLIVMEGVSSRDLNLGDGPEAFLAVDISEYYGGRDIQTAEHIVITQVKYSPTYPDKSWSLSRLCANTTSKPRSSILGKLARTFETLLRNTDGSARKITFQIHTNQPLDVNLRSQLSEISRLVRDQTPYQASTILRNQTGELGQLLESLKEATRLTWTRLSLFIQSWNLDTFGQSLLVDQKGELFSDLQAIRDASADLYMERLCLFAQERGTANRRHDILPSHVYAQLRVTEDDFLPAPFRPEPVQYMQQTHTIRELETLVEKTDSGLILFHGSGGTGKSVTLQHFAQTYQGGKATVLYDCWASGDGIQPGSERYWLRGFLTQVINELEDLYECEIFAVRNDTTESLLRRFRRSLEICAQIAFTRGHRLVLIVDAADNAVKGFGSALNKNEDTCFVPLFWKFLLPSNCVVIVSSRTERIRALGIPETQTLQELQVSGFQPQESASYIRAYLGPVEDDLVNFIHRRTEGVPRLLQAILEREQRLETDDLRAFVDRVARGSLEKYYQEACADIVSDYAEAQELLATILELQQPRVNVLADIVGKNTEEVQRFIQALYFGLRITNENEVSFRNEDFYNFVDEFAMPIRHQIQAQVADYCKSSYVGSAYARDNFAFHLYRAEQYDELVEWQLSEQLDRRIQSLAPNQEDALQEVQLGIQAAINVERFDAALALLIKAASIANGRDVFSGVARRYIETSVEFGYHFRLLEYLEKTDTESDLPGPYFKIAAALAQLGREPDFAEELTERGIAIMRQDKARRDVWYLEDIASLVLYKSYNLGLSKALEWLQSSWDPQENLFPIYAQVTREWAVHRTETVWPEIEVSQLQDEQCAYALSGMLSSIAGIPDEHLKAAAAKMLELLDSTEITLKDLEYISDIIANVLKADLDSSLVLSLNELWRPRILRSPVQRWFPGDELHDFLRKQALNVELGLISFEPETYELPPLPDESERRKRLHDHEAYELGEFRKQLKRHYPAAQAVVKALLDAPEAEVLGCVEQGLKNWREYAGQRWYKVDRTVTAFGQECLLALILLDGNHIALAQEVCQVVEDALGTKGAYKELIDILTSDQRYHGVSERLIQARVDDISLLQEAAETRVKTVLDLCPNLLRIGDTDQARHIFQMARVEANAIDSRAQGRIKALSNALFRASDNKFTLSDLQARYLITLLDYLSEVSDRDSAPDLSALLRVVARDYPSIALEGVRFFETKNHLSFGKGLVAVGQGLLDRQLTSPEHIWPLSHASNSANELFLQQAAEQMIDDGSTSNLERLLLEWARRIRCSVEYHVQLEKTEGFVTWAERKGLSSHNVVDAMRQHLACLQRLKAPAEDFSPGYHHARPSELGVKLRSELDHDAHEAFEHIRSLEPEDLEHLEFVEFRAVVDGLLPNLMSRDIASLSEVILRRDDWGYAVGDSVTLLAQLANRTRPNAIAFDIVKKNIKTFVLSNLPRLLSRSYLYEDIGIADLIRTSSIETDYILEILLAGVINHLSHLDADQIYLAISYLVMRLSGDEAGRVFSLLLEQACLAADVEPIAPVHLAEEYPDEISVNFVCNLLGDPRQEVNWRASYILADSALSSPTVVLPILFRWADSESHERWMTIREWILFIIHHVALRSPETLVPFVKQLENHALNSTFPHAIVRESAKAALLEIEKQLPGTILAETKGRVFLVNEPRANLISSLVPPEGMSYEGVPWSGRSLDDESFRYDPIDTMPYWLSSLAHCFGLHRCHVADAGVKWVVGKWGITTERCREDYQQHLRRFGEDRFYDRHQDGLPAIVTLENYVEYHSLYLVAGEFVNAKPVYPELQDGRYRSWDDWARSHLYPADPALTALLLTGIPPVSDNFGEFQDDYENWASKSNPSDFEAELFPEIDRNDWVIVAANRSGQRNERQFSVSVASALVHPETAYSLIRAIEDEPPEGGIFLPHFELPYNGLLSRLSMCDEQHAITEWPDEPRIRDGEDPFWLEPIYTSWGSERSRHSHDPKWPSTGRSFLMPSREFCSSTNLRQRPLSLDYADPSGQVATRSEVWHAYADTNRDRAEYVEGRRLIIRRDLLQEYLGQKGRWLVLKVQLQRQRPYGFYGRKADDFDHGTVRVYALTEEGQIVKC